MSKNDGQNSALFPSLDEQLTRQDLQGLVKTLWAVNDGIAMLTKAIENMELATRDLTSQLLPADALLPPGQQSPQPGQTSVPGQAET